MSRAQEYLKLIEKNNDFNKKEFVNYVMDFYGPKGLYSQFFGKGVTRQEVELATDMVMRKFPGFSVGSWERELVRDVLFRLKGIKKKGETEYDVSKYLK